jgi:hypothetical protein
LKSEAKLTKAYKKVRSKTGKKEAKIFGIFRLEAKPEIKKQKHCNFFA